MAESDFVYDLNNKSFMVVRIESKAKMKKNGQENKSASLPVKISDFQPRIDK